MRKKSLLPMVAFMTLIILGVKLVLGFFSEDSFLAKENIGWWEIQSIDTVKYSRDLAREKQEDISFDEIMEDQVINIALTGATHVALGTPYDEEFIPFLVRWVSVARKHDLKVWFRGNFSGWEGWFGYKRINRQQHLSLLEKFILANGGLFEDGDIFSACTECENGGPGDPRRTGDVKGHREFLINEYKVTSDAFRKIGKNVRSNFFPMNGDVARLIMDKATTQKLGGIVTIDHYVATPEILLKDIAEIADTSGGKVFLGEFGAPIPDIHGRMSETEQSQWIRSALGKLSKVPELVGLNYWVSYGGSTKLWEDNNEPRMAVFAIVNYFKPKLLTGKVTNEIGRPIAGAKVILEPKSFVTQKGGDFVATYVLEDEVLTVLADSYQSVRIENLPDDKNVEVVLVKKSETIFFKVYKFFYKAISK